MKKKKTVRKLKKNIKSQIKQSKNQKPNQSSKKSIKAKSKDVVDKDFFQKMLTSLLPQVTEKILSHAKQVSQQILRKKKQSEK